MSIEFKPDFGIFFKKNFGEETENIFYKVLIFQIAQVGHNLYSFTSNNKYGDNEYAVSFDFTTDKLKTIIRSISGSDLAQLLLSVLLKPFENPEKVEFKNNPIQADIVASLGQPVKSLYEEFIPFIIEDIKNI